MKGQARASQCYHRSSSHGPADRRLTVYQAKCDAFLPWSEFFVYRLLKSLEPHVRQVVLTRRVEHAELFPMPHVEQLSIATLLSFYQSHRAACRLQSRYRGDLIHAHFGSSAAKLLVLKQLMRLPMVVTFGGKDISVHAQRKITGQIYRYMFDAVEQIVTVSEDLRQCAIARGCPPEKVVTIRRGVDLDEFSLVDRAARDVGRIDILMVSRLVQKKGHAHALAALARLPVQAPEWRLRIIGEGPQEKHLRRQVAGGWLAVCVFPGELRPRLARLLFSLESPALIRRPLMQG